MKRINIELSKYNLSDILWSDLIEYFGFEKAKKIISQAIDLQKMSGKKDVTIPIVFIGTGCLALISIEKVIKGTLINNIKKDQILIFNQKKKLYQLLSGI